MNGNNGRRKEHALEVYIKKTGALEYIRANDVQHLAVRIFKDIAYGNINQKEMEKYAQFFLDDNNIDNLLIIANAKCTEAAIICNGLDAYQKASSNTDLSQSIMPIHRKWYSIYSLYSNITNTFASLKSSKDIRILYGLPTVLAPLRRFFNNF